MLLFDFPLAGMICRGCHDDLVRFRREVAGLMHGDGVQSLAEDKEGTMQNKKPENLPLFEKVLAGSCVAALGTSLASESVFTMTILSVTVLAIVSVLFEVWK